MTAYNKFIAVTFWGAGRLLQYDISWDVQTRCGQAFGSRGGTGDTGLGALCPVWDLFL